MIYLDYAANTPTDPQVLDTFCKLTQQYIANPNASHALGKEAHTYIEALNLKMAQNLGIQEETLIYTSGASEANNLALKGVAHAYKNRGKHLITTYLEHASVINPMMALKEEGYEVDFVDLLPDGTVDLEHLKLLLREDTLLVSINAVDSEMGIIQPTKAIADCIKAHSQAVFHVDATQAISKISFDMTCADLVTLTPHKFYGLNGSGLLIKKKGIELSPLIHGGGSTTPYRSGSPTLALNGALFKALEQIKINRIAYTQKVEAYNQQLRKALAQYKQVVFNSPLQASPYILNFSVKGVLGTVFQEALSQEGVYVATKSACTQAKLPSRPVYAVTKDRKRALWTLRISLSHLTTPEEIEGFLAAFDKCYKNLI